jgi:hypothetical protein
MLTSRQGYPKMSPYIYIHRRYNSNSYMFLKMFSSMKKAVGKIPRDANGLSR